MGSTNQQQQSYALVSMTNKDVYYIDKIAARQLINLIDNEQSGFFQTIDRRSSSSILLAIKNISSIVVMGGDDER